MPRSIAAAPKGIRSRQKGAGPLVLLAREQRLHTLALDAFREFEPCGAFLGPILPGARREEGQPGAALRKLRKNSKATMPPRP